MFANYQNLLEKYGENGGLKKKFGISTQHYSFATKSFVEMVKKFNTDEYRNLKIQAEELATKASNINKYNSTAKEWTKKHAM